MWVPADSEACAILDCSSSVIAGSELSAGMYIYIYIWVFRFCVCPMKDLATDLTTLIFSEIINSYFEPAIGPSVLGWNRICTCMNFVLMSDIALVRACFAVPLYISLIALASCSRHARPLAPASPPPATHSLCSEQFCLPALLYCMRAGCLLCCCLFIRQSPAGVPPSAAAAAFAQSAFPQLLESLALWHWTLQWQLFDCGRILSGASPHKSFPHPNVSLVSFWPKEIFSKTVGGGIWSVSAPFTEFSLQGWRSDRLRLL
jgi:hypothetical protein